MHGFVMYTLMESGESGTAEIKTSELWFRILLESHWFLLRVKQIGSFGEVVLTTMAIVSFHLKLGTKSEGAGIRCSGRKYIVWFP